MKRGHLVVLGVILLAASALLVRPAISRAADATAAAAPAVTPVATGQANAPDQSIQQWRSACLSALNLPTAAQRADAMAKLMNDPAFVANMSQLMADPRVAAAMAGYMNSQQGRSLMGSMMGGWAGVGTPATGGAANSVSGNAFYGRGCH